MSGDEPKQPSWMREISVLLAEGKHERVFRILDRVVDTENPLFWGDPAYDRTRRSAWLYRIRLLRDLGRRSEALAWTCLECEMNPENAAAQALKEELKGDLRLTAPELPGAGGRVEWPGVAGMRDLKIELERDVVLPLRQPAIHQRYGLRPPNGILFYGPPGCGKTHLARALGKQLEYAFYEVEPSRFASIYVHGSQKLIAEFFADAAKRAPCVLFLDELDALLPARDQAGLHHHYAEAVNEFLVHLNACHQKGLLVVGATNQKQRVDPAAIRPGRIEHHFFVGPPDFEGRHEALQQHMRSRPQERIDFLNLAAASDGLVFADLEFATNQAARAAMARGASIRTEDLLGAIRALVARRQTE
ncbi:MAG: ATP-binding protein [Candidatus Eisenbacteria bacterium]|nr:ATP-binding protein [Candidatus Eisenbacteria bacterium]